MKIRINTHELITTMKIHIIKNDRIPEEVRIGNSHYKVIQHKIVTSNFGFDALLNLIKGQVRLGQINFNNKEIKIKKDGYNKRKTFLHEVAHGIMYEMEKRYPKASAWNNDEAFMGRLGIVLDKTLTDLKKGGM